MFNIVVLGLTSLLTDISTEMVYPLLPFFLTSALGAGPATVGLVEGVAESLASFLKIASGRVSDRFRRRKPLTILGYASSAAGKLLLSLATGWGMVLGGRVIDRFGKGIRTAPRDALIADGLAVRDRGRAFGLHRAMDTAGAAAGVLLAYGFLTVARVEIATIILWSLVPATLGVLVLLFVREGRPEHRSRAVLPSLSWSTLPRRLRRLLLIVLFFNLGNSSNAFLLLRAQDVGFSPSSVLLLYLLYNLSFAALSLPAGKLSDRVGRTTLLGLGYAVYGIAYLGFALLTPRAAPLACWALFALYGVYSALTEGVERALVADLAQPETRATALGMHAAVIGIGLLPASMLAGALWEIAGPPAPFILGAVLSGGAAVAIRDLRKDPH